MAEEIDLTFERFDYYKGYPIALMTWMGKRKELPALLLNSHTDVVPVLEVGLQFVSYY